MNCLLYLNDRDNEFNECTPDECDRYGCRLNSNYSKASELLDYDFAEMNRWSKYSIFFILYLNVTSILVSLMIYQEGFNIILKTIVLSIIFILIIGFNYVLYLERKYWLDKNEKTKKFYEENKLGTTEE